VASELELALLEEEHRGARKRLVRGVLQVSAVPIGALVIWGLAGAAGTVVAALLVVLYFFFGLLMVIVGLKNVLQGSVELALSARELKQMKRLPQARLLDRPRR
jgi:sulfite exporter TauE/SafE